MINKLTKEKNIATKVNLPASQQDTETWPAGVHVFERRDLLAIDAARAAKRPLLVRGEPGTGKSQLARAVAKLLEIKFVSYVVTSKTEINDLFFHYDTIRRLGEAQILSALKGQINHQDIKKQLDPANFISPGPMWWALDWASAEAQHNRFTEQNLDLSSASQKTQENNKQKTVLLIDEIDKAETDLANDLLEVLANGAFRADILKKRIGSSETSDCELVVITSNDERQLPPAFLRRCIVLQLSLPTDENEFEALLVNRGIQHHTDENKELTISETVLKQAAKQLYADRQAAQSRGLPLPGQAEYLDMINALKDNVETEQEQLELLEEISEYIFQKHDVLRTKKENKET